MLGELGLDFGTKCLLTIVVCIRAYILSGAVKFLTRWLNLQLSKPRWTQSTIILANPNLHLMAFSKPESRSSGVILRVLAAPSSRTLQTLWSLS